MTHKLKKLWVKNHSKFIVATTVIFALLGIINFFFIFDVTAQSNDECLWIPRQVKPDSASLFFSNVKFKGVTWQAGIRDGDQLLAIDGIPTGDLQIASKILDRVQKGDYATYTVKRIGKVFETQVLVKKLINFVGLAFALLSFLWLLVGFVVVIAKPEGRTQLLFYRIGIAAMLYSLVALLFRGANVANPIFENKLVLILVDNAWTLGGSLFPFLLVKFFCIFPKENALQRKKWFNVSLIVLPLAIFAIVSIIKIKYVYSGLNPMFYETLSTILHIILTGGFIAGLVILLISYTKLKTKYERNSIFIILVAYLVGVVALLYTYTLAATIAGIIFNNPAYFTPIILIALLPVAFGYSIFRYSLMDVSEVVRTTVFYGVATVTIAAVYFVLIYILGQSISYAVGTEYQGVIAGAVFVLSAVVFQSTKDKFQNFLTRKFYPEQFAFESGLLIFSNDIASVVGLENIFDSTSDLFTKNLKIKAFCLMLKDTKGDFKPVRKQNIIGTDWSFSDPGDLVGRYISECGALGKKLVIERQEFETIFGGMSKKFFEEEIYTAVPLLANLKVIGIMLFGLKHSGSQFSGKDIDLLTAVGSQTAISIEIARLYESETEKKKLEHDLENARKIQETLLPKVFPKIGGIEVAGKMIPAMHVGGDYFDLIKVAEDRLFVVIGDVSGKGLSASIYMSKLQTMIRLYCDEKSSPKDVLVEVNKRIYESIERNWFITVSIALFDVENKTVSFCRAGHTSLLRADLNGISSFQPSGIGVGLERGDIFRSSLEEVTLSLHDNDLYFFYTDGVTESMNEKDEFFGIERTGRILLENRNRSCAVIESALLNSLEKFRGPAQQYDDITTVLLKYKV
jgi:serine phosphatase RsbU (regulator of sigma subunit)